MGASAAAAAASAAAVAAARAAGQAANHAARAGAEPAELDLIAQAAATLETARARVRAQRLPPTDAQRALHAVWIEFVAPFFRVLDDPTRLKILGLLKTHGSMTVGEIKSALKLELSSTSAQLGRLRAAQLISVRREAQTRHYSLNRNLLAWWSKVLVEGLS